MLPLGEIDKLTPPDASLASRSTHPGPLEHPGLPDEHPIRIWVDTLTALATGLLAVGILGLENVDSMRYVAGAFVWRPADLQFGF